MNKNIDRSSILQMGGAFKAAVLGSTATRIAAISDTPLLVIQAN